VVQLPCDKAGRHRFDLECVGPWLRVKGTCPLDRKMVDGKAEKAQKEREARERRRENAGNSREETRAVKKDEDEDEEWDDMYA